MGGFKKTLLYALYTGACVAVFLYTLFPEEPVKRYLEGRFAREVSGVVLDIERVRPSFPPGIAVLRAFILQGEDPFALLEKVRISPALLSLWKPTPALDVSADVFGGGLKGKAVFDSRSFDNVSQVSGSIRGVRLESIHALRQMSENAFSGRLDGRFREAGKEASEPDLTLTASDVGVELAEGFMGIDTLAFSRCAVAANLEQNRMTLANVEMHGRQFDIRAKGSIVFRAPIGETRLVLSGSLTPHPELMAAMTADGMSFKRKPGDEGIAFSVSGTWARPVFQWR